MVWHVVYHYVVVNFGDPSALLEPTWYAFSIVNGRLTDSYMVVEYY